MTEDTSKRDRVTSFCMNKEEEVLIKRQSAIEDRGKGAILRDALTLYVILKGSSLNCTALESIEEEANQ